MKGYKEWGVELLEWSRWPFPMGNYLVIYMNEVIVEAYMHRLRSRYPERQAPKVVRLIFR